MDEDEYQRLADEFLGGPRAAETWECRRRNGDIVRYNAVSDEFGVLNGAGVIRTYLKLDPTDHPTVSNLQYFFAQCRS